MGFWLFYIFVCKFCDKCIVTRAKGIRLDIFLRSWYLTKLDVANESSMLCSFISDSRGTWLLLCVFVALGQLKYNVEISGTYNSYQLNFIKFCNVFHLRKKVVFHFRLFYQLLFEFQELLLLHC